VPKAPDRRHAQAQALAPTWLAMPAKAQAQEDKPRTIGARGLPDTVLQAWPCRLLSQQGHEWGVTQEGKLPTTSMGWATLGPTC
jgi:hypothetical protein